MFCVDTFWDDKSVGYHFGVIVTLTSDLISRIIVYHSIAYPILSEVGIMILVCGCISGCWSVAHHFQVTVTLTSDLISRIIMSGVYLQY